MVSVKLIGGLGNQMFQYALGRKLSLKLSVSLEIDISGFQVYKLHKFGLSCFQLSDTTSIANTPENSQLVKTINKFLPLKFHFGYKHVEEQSFAFNGDALKLEGDLYIDGYWQSEKYFKDIRATLLEDFRIIHLQDPENASISDKIDLSNAVSLHIRRGDYINNSQTLEKHGVCGLDYYYKAIEYITARVDNPSFFIFSDDSDWAKENLKIDYPVTFISNNDASKNYEDLRLMSQCKHNIIANSSFSWWGAWLNDSPAKIVIAPRQWFNDKEIDTTDLIPETWISL
jgi:hypothetical protein